jgi:hypothetical protein
MGQPYHDYPGGAILLWDDGLEGEMTKDELIKKINDQQETIKAQALIIRRLHEDVRMFQTRITYLVGVIDAKADYAN